MMWFVEWPSALALVILLPVLGSLAVTLEQRSRARRRAKLGTPAMLARLAPFAARLGPWRTFRITAALACCSVAVAGPRWGVDSKLTYNTGIDVVLAMDASLSMMAPDAPPTRLDNMKTVVRQLRAARSTDRFAMIAFADHSYVLSPLTTDQGALDMYLDGLDTATVGVRGTSLSSAIDQAVALLGNQPVDSSRAIVLMSDGESFEPKRDIIEAAERAANAGIRLVMVGVGTERGSKIPVLSQQGDLTDMRDTAGRVVVTRYVPSLLSEAAQAGHGVFIPADAPDKAARIGQVLTELSPATRATRTGETLLPKFQWFIAPALVLLMLETLLALRLRRVVGAAVVVAMLGAATACHRPPAEQAPSATPRARRPDFASMIIYNRGTKLLSKNKLRDALRPLDSAATSRDRQVNFRASFNGGWSALTSAMRIKKALGARGRARDNAAADSAALAALASARGGRGGRGDSMVTGPTDEVEVIGPSDKPIVDSINAMVSQLDYARARYRAALLTDPDDMDAKWNYELASLQGKVARANKYKYVKIAKAAKSRATRSGSRGKQDNRSGNPKKGNTESKALKGPRGAGGGGAGTGLGGGSAPKEGPWIGYTYVKGSPLDTEDMYQWKKEDPPVEKLRLPPQEAEQILNAAGQRAWRAPTTAPNTRSPDSRPPW